MIFSYTRSADPLAIGKAPNHLYKWEDAQGDIYSLLDWAYIQGRAFVTGTFDLESPLEGEEKTHRNIRLWRGSRLLLLDIDNAPGTTISDVLDNEFISRHALALFPSSSFTYETLKLHILIPLSEVVTDHRVYRDLGLHLISLLPFPFDRATLNAAQPTYGTHFVNEEMRSHVKGLNDGLCHINPDATPFDVSSFVLDPVEVILGGLGKRTKAHESADHETQTKIVIEALAYVLNDAWGELERDERLETIMSAFQGSSDPEVLQTFLSYSSPRWDVSGQKRTLSEWWEKHKPREGGITVATLFAQARANGWLQISSVELQGSTKIYEPDLSEWITSIPLPQCLLIKSATGSGKTQAAIKLINDKMCDGFKVVLFAPSIKLCHALSASLTKAGVENTLYIENNRKTKDAETLRKANVLVTTLQTFAVKAFAGDKTVTYDLVIMDECDELLSAFVRSGISRKISSASHVDAVQSRYGIDALEHLFKTSKNVLMLDGTMTELSRFIASQWSKDIGVYENTFKREKAPVTFYPTLQSVRDDLTDRVLEGSRVVVACDTKAEAALIEQLLILANAVEPENVLRVTGDTAADQRVNTFFRDVEQGAKDYRVIIYNSAMGSGVSITETTPDYLYLIGTYLAPRKLLQMLNRYRSQSEVRIYVQPRENIYQISAVERYNVLQGAAKHEESLLGIERVQRSEIASIVSHAALLAATDEFEQSRSVRDFFIQLLNDEGREVHFVQEETEFYVNTLYEVKELLKQEKQEVRETWRSVAPIRRGDSFPDDISITDAAKGLLHGYIADLFPDNEGKGISDSEIARLAVTYGKYKNILRHLLNPESIMKVSLDELQNRRKESVTYRLYMARTELLTQLSKLFPSAEGEYAKKDMEDRALSFLREVKDREAVYNLVAPSNAPYSSLIGDPVKRALSAAKVLLKSIGLGTAKRNGRRIGKSERRERLTGIKNTEDVKTFCELANISNSSRLDDFNSSVFSLYRDQLSTVIPAYNALRDERKIEVRDILDLADASFVHSVRLQGEKLFA